MKIPGYLLEQVRDGNVVLLLGAGASMGAADSNGNPPPMGQKLAEMLAAKFLGGENKDQPLQVVAELAISESSQPIVQDYIRVIFEDIWPSEFHKLLTTFKWKGLATTNFDIVIERAYEDRKKDRTQDLVPFIKDGDRVEDKLRSLRSLMLLKLHGCITNTSDDNVPLILSIDQYITHRRGRERLFSTLKEWAYEHPIVFVGHSLQDPDIRQMLLELGHEEKRQRFYIVAPKFTDVEKRHWEGKRISPLEGSFNDFLVALDDGIRSVFRGVVIPLPEPELAISRRFIVSKPDISPRCRDFLTNDVEYVKEAAPTTVVTPAIFYRGFHGEWSSIDQGLDVHRDLADTILTDAILSEETNGFQLYLLKGHAGSGKSVLIRRIAWEAAKSFDKLCLFMKPHGRLSFEGLRELYQLTKEHIFLFVDNAAEHSSELLETISKAKQAKLPLTIIVAERNNEWNMSCESLNSHISEEYEIEYLTRKEISGLLILLERNHVLCALEHASPEERMKAFEYRAGRQLLVALHEATLGKPFEDIIVDEYKEIMPDLAKRMYLGICILNRLDVPVRAGVIARVYSIPFSEFRDKFFRPLEKVVFCAYDDRTRDYVYRARHPHIADIVFQRTLSTQEQRLDAYIPLLKALNIDYDSDRTAYRRLIRARSLLELFPDHQKVQNIYKICGDIAGDDPYLYQQMSIYEMRRADGNLDDASDYLKYARDLAPRDRSILHSSAELLLRKSELARSSLESQAYIREAQNLAGKLTGPDATDSYGYHTLAKIGLAKLHEIIGRSDESQNEFEISEAIRETGDAIEKGIQRFPDAEYLMDAESELCKILDDNAGVVDALRRAFETNPHSCYAAIRLAKSLLKNGQAADASKIYQQAIEANPNERSLHYHYAKLLLHEKSVDGDTLEFHLRRAFTEGDRNYDAQFWYARQLYINGKIGESHERFLKLRESPIDPVKKREIRGIMETDDKAQIFNGSISRLESSYGWIRRDGTSDGIYIHISFTGQDFWQQLHDGMRVKFSIGFTFHGPAALNINSEK